MVLRSPTSSTVKVPTKIGTPTESTASLINARAWRSRKGLTSEEFSGHSTISTSSPESASSWVTLTWLSNTALRCALNSKPKRGTLPWIAATLIVSVVCSGWLTPSCARKLSPNGTKAQTIATPRIPHPLKACLSMPPRTSISTAAIAVPTVAAATVTSAGPPQAARKAKGPSTCPQPSRTQENPPKGAEDRSNSTAR